MPNTFLMTEPKRLKCHAKSKRTGKQCGQWALEGARVCRMHGAGGGRPVTHGRYSKALGKLAANYEASLNDRSLFDLREPIAALDGVTQRLMAMVDEHDSPEWRRNVRAKYKAVREALSAGAPSAAQLMEELGELIDRGAAEGSNLEALGSNLDKLARRIEGAWGVHLQKTQVMNKAELVGLLAKFLSIVRDEAGGSIANRVQAQLMVQLSPTRELPTVPEPDEQD